MALVYLGVGSNLGNRFETLSSAKRMLAEQPGIKLSRCSAFYEMDPVGGPSDQGKYLNAVWELETELDGESLLQCLQSVERQHGRERPEPDAPRTLDLDILLYNDELIETPELSIPHPRLHERFFVLKPLCDLVPQKMHPRLKTSLKSLLEKQVASLSKP